MESEALSLAASSSSKALSKVSMSKSEDANFRLNIRRMSGGSLVSKTKEECQLPRTSGFGCATQW